MDLKKLADSLHAYERKVLVALRTVQSVAEIATETSLQPIEVMRGLQWLENKELVILTESEQEFIELDSNGKLYAEKGLPERRFLKVLDKEKSLDAVAKDAGLSREESTVCIGVLKSKAAIELRKEKGLFVSLTEQGSKLLEKESLEEQFLARSFPVLLESLSAEEKFAFDALLKRKQIVSLVRKKSYTGALTDLGKELISAGVSGDAGEESLTAQMLVDGSWKGKKFRRYDVGIKVPKKPGARKHHYGRFLDEVREQFMALGFSEMSGPLVETEFWGMDALFMPQFHSARDIHGAYYTESPKNGSVDKKFMELVKGSHEQGKGTISKGWGYQFSEQKTQQHILRTQGTALSARMLASPDLQIPGKYFSIARCFRPDVVDATHAPDFNQVEGIVVEEGLDFRHLNGLLNMFAKEFAHATKIKIKPAYFPFTEPSAELFAKHPDLGWIELGGSGILRPEVVKPLLGREVSVLAWGLGIDRIAMFNLGIKDIRELFSRKLDFIRGAKVI